MWAKGELPNLKALAEKGSMVDLATTKPPESPVAWASFSIGANPGKHGIYDKGPNTNLVVRSRDPERLAAAVQAVTEMLAKVKVQVARG